MAQEQEVIIRPRVASGRVEKQLRQLARRAQKEAAREAARATKEATSRALKADLEAAFGKSSTRTIDAVKKKAVSLSRTLVATGRSHACVSGLEPRSTLDEATSPHPRRQPAMRS